MGNDYHRVVKGEGVFLNLLSARNVRVREKPARKFGGSKK